MVNVPEEPPWQIRAHGGPGSFLQRAELEGGGGSHKMGFLSRLNGSHASCPRVMVWHCQDPLGPSLLHSLVLLSTGRATKGGYRISRRCHKVPCLDLSAGMQGEGAMDFARPFLPMVLKSKHSHTQEAHETHKESIASNIAS